MASPEEIDRIGQVLLSLIIEHLSIPNIRLAIGAAGLNAAALTAESERKGGSGSRAEIGPQIFALWKNADAAARDRALPILAQRLQGAGDTPAAKAKSLLEQHGFRFENGAFVPVDAIDERERKMLPGVSFDELQKAGSRIFDGDFSGAITSACGAVDSITQQLYEKHAWGAPPDSFQAKVNTALGKLAIFDNMKADLLANGMKQADAEAIVTNLHESIKRATDALQTLRRAMGDVHGSKTAMRHLAYDAVKYASAICALFE